MDCSLPGSSILGIFQASVLEWDAIAFSARITKGYECNPSVQTYFSCIYFYDLFYHECSVEVESLRILLLSGKIEVHRDFSPSVDECQG